MNLSGGCTIEKGGQKESNGFALSGRCGLEFLTEDKIGRIVEIGNDPNMYSSLRRPSFYFKDVQFSGI